MALVEGVNKETAVAAVDELAAKFSDFPAQLADAITKNLKDTLAGKKLVITVVLEDKQP